MTIPEPPLPPATVDTPTYIDAPPPLPVFEAPAVGVVPPLPPILLPPNLGLGL